MLEYIAIKLISSKVNIRMNRKLVPEI